MLAALIEDELAAVTELQRLLNEEYDALKGRSLTDLELITSAKQHCSERLGRHLEQRSEHLRRHGFGADRAGMDACIAACPPPQRAHLARLWEALQGTALRVREQNQINGAIVAAGRSHVERALAILQGREPDTCLYGHNAQTTSGGPSRPLAKA